VAPFASADLILGTARTQSIASGPWAGMDQVRFYILNDGANGTGTKLIGVAAQMTTDQHFNFRFANLDADSTPDADIQMSETTTIPFHNSDGSEPTNRTTAAFSTSATSINTGTAIRPVGSGKTNWNAQVFIPTIPESNPTVTLNPDDGGVETATPTTVTNYNNTNINSFRVEGAYLGPQFAVPAGANLNGGLGALFAVAIVPHGASVTMTTSAAGDIGPTLDLPALTNAVPEPATLGLLSLGGMAILGRRRRKA